MEVAYTQKKNEMDVAEDTPRFGRFFSKHNHYHCTLIKSKWMEKTNYYKRYAEAAFLSISKLILHPVIHFILSVFDKTGSVLHKTREPESPPLLG